MHNKQINLYDFVGLGAYYAQKVNVIIDLYFSW